MIYHRVSTVVHLLLPKVLTSIGAYLLGLALWRGRRWGHTTRCCRWGWRRSWRGWWRWWKKSTHTSCDLNRMRLGRGRGRDGWNREQARRLTVSRRLRLRNRCLGHRHSAAVVRRHRELLWRWREEVLVDVVVQVVVVAVAAVVNAH